MSKIPVIHVPFYFHLYMSKQINFFAIPDDIAPILAIADQIGCRVLPERVDAQIYDAQGFVPPIPLESYNWENAALSYLLPDTVPSVEAIYRTNNTTKVAILNVNAPVIQFVPSTNIVTNRYLSGRFYMNTPPFYSPGTVHPYYKLVVKTYHQIIKPIRKWEYLPKERRYVGPKTLNLAKQGKIYLTRTKSRVLVYQKKIINGAFKIYDLVSRTTHCQQSL